MHWEIGRKCNIESWPEQLCRIGLHCTRVRVCARGVFCAWLHDLSMNSHIQRFPKEEKQTPTRMTTQPSPTNIHVHPHNDVMRVPKRTQTVLVNGRKKNGGECTQCQICLSFRPFFRMTGHRNRHCCLFLLSDHSLHPFTLHPNEAIGILKARGATGVQNTLHPPESGGLESHAQLRKEKKHPAQAASTHTSRPLAARHRQHGDRVLPKTVLSRHQKTNSSKTMRVHTGRTSSRDDQLARG